jgi:nanoRNase/pAp phosphatase (c-di-AMP/oligoRNAs hydrolase)
MVEYFSDIKRLGEKHEVKFFVEQPLSKTLSWMLEYIHADVIDITKAVEWKPETLVVLDCAPTEWRTGFPIERYIKENPTGGPMGGPVRVMNIDHHADRVDESLGFTANVVIHLDPEASSTAELIYKYGFSNNHILYTGMATDTGNFKFSHPSRAMKAIVDMKITDETIEKFRKNLEIHLDAEQFKVMFKSDIRHYMIGGKSLIVVNIPAVDDEVNTTFLNITKGFDFVAIIQKDGRVSLRTRCETDLSVFAKKFKGGGHPKASGCMIENLDEFLRFIDEYVKFVGGCK